MSLAAVEAAYRRAKAAYHMAAVTLAEWAEQLISSTIHEAFPTITEVTVEGEYDEESEIRLTLQCPDGVDKAAWEAAVVDTLEQPLYDLASTTGEDWLGIHVLHVTA